MAGPFPKSLETNETESPQAAPVRNMSDEGSQRTGCPEGEAERGPVASTPAVQKGDTSIGRSTTAHDDEQQVNCQEEQWAKVAEDGLRAKAAEEEQLSTAATEEERRAKAAAEEDERRAKAAEEDERRAKAAEEERRAKAAQAEEERRAVEQARQQEIQRLRLEWSEGEWTASRAVQRYIHLFNDFKTGSFSPDSPIEFDLIPWPVLWEPSRLLYQTPTWQAVEEFFKIVQHLVPSRAYVGFLTQAKLHFHPDRLTGRRILSSLNEREHDRARTSFGIVTQAVGSLITELNKT